MAEFVDRVVLHVSGGRGGNGCVSVRREKFKPLGGPNGGNGGNGGAVILRVDNQTTTLLEYHHSPHQHAPNGDIGRGDMHHGYNGEDLVLTVPQGTVVRTARVMFWLTCCVWATSMLLRVAVWAVWVMLRWLRLSVRLPVLLCWAPPVKRLILFWSSSPLRMCSGGLPLGG